MSYELRRLISSLVPPTWAVTLTKVPAAQDAVRLQLTATATTAFWPSHSVPSTSVHSRYLRHLAGDGILTVAGPAKSGAFSVATANVGASGLITATANTHGVSLLSRC
jgi:hypothetical protein